METIHQNIETINQRISKACEKAGRSREEVKLLLATKTVSAERIKLAMDAGCTLIAENKVQELKEKFDDLKEIPHNTHFIGNLQSNKVKEIIRYGVDCLESVDRMSLAEKLHKRLVFEGKTMEVLIQVNTSYEESKFGVRPENAVELVRKVAQFETLKI